MGVEDTALMNAPSAGAGLCNVSATTTKRRAFAFSFAALVVVGLGAVTAVPTRADLVLGVPCQYNHQCKEPLACIDNRCGNACLKDRDCPEGMSCEDVPSANAKVCRKIPSRASCVRDTDCASRRCTAGKC